MKVIICSQTSVSSSVSASSKLKVKDQDILLSIQRNVFVFSGVQRNLALVPTVIKATRPSCVLARQKYFWQLYIVFKCSSLIQLDSKGGRTLDDPTSNYS